MRLRPLLQLITSLVAATLLFSSAALAQSSRLTLYVSHPTEMVDFYVERFTNATGIEVDIVYGGTGELLARIGAEAGNPQADIMWGGGSHTGSSAPELFRPYESAALDGISEAMLDPNGYNAPFDAFTMVIVYNKDLVPEDEVPRTWAELADPKWKGKVVHANPAASSSSYAAMVTWLTIGGWDLVEALAKNQIIADSSSAPFTQVGQGENALGVAYEEGAFRWIDSGRIGIVYPEDGVAFLPGGLFLVANSPNPDGAQAFADFVLSLESQEALVENFLGRRPTHKDVALNPAMQPPSALNVIAYPEADAAANREQNLAQWRDIMIRTR